MPLWRPLPAVVVECEERVGEVGDTCANDGVVRWMRVTWSLVEAADGVRRAWVVRRGGGVARR